MNSESDFSINSNIASKKDLTKRATNSIESAFHDKNRRMWSYGKSIKIKSKLRNRTIESENTYSMVDDPCAAQLNDKERYQIIVRTSIPTSYAIFGGLFFTLSCLFGFSFMLSVWKSIYLVNPWYSLMLCLGCLVLFLTDVRACAEWRRIFNEKEGQNKQ